MENIRFNSRLIHPEVQSVSRESVLDSLKEERTTLPFFSKYEYTALIGTRAQQLAEGAKPLVELKGFNLSSSRLVWDIAEKEVKEKKLPYIIHRQFTNGKSEYWSATELSIIW